MRQPSGGIFAFIDSQNLNLGVKNDIYEGGKRIYQGWSLDFKKFRFYLRDKFNVSRAFLFIGKISGNEPLYQYLENIGFEVIYKPTLTYHDKHQQIQTKGNVDAELVLHTMIQLNNFEKAVIVSGDGDYFCLVEYLEKHQKLLKILIPNKARYSHLLSTFAQYMIFVSDLRSNLENKKTGIRGRPKP